MLLSMFDGYAIGDDDESIALAASSIGRIFFGSTDLPKPFGFAAAFMFLSMKSTDDETRVADCVGTNPCAGLDASRTTHSSNELGNR